ncbi:hypothetical protein [Sporosalibacterium faouarense]|uniref:hypothetical protein n=1 Tax=Sporosalibacterium faouarense TaxID=516123 RepID=UPI00141CD823|nr:hypothetical protein [Sporosalibacterium faouarense]MTI48124.1 hypothetical protein [Bacillota bacterium]
MDIITYIIIILLLVLLGYSVGRRVGYKQGYEEGVSYAPIEMKRKIHKLKKCPICNKPIDE